MLSDGAWIGTIGKIVFMAEDIIVERIIAEKRAF